MPTPTMCYLWFHQGKDKWVITPLHNLEHRYSDKVRLSPLTHAESFTISNGKSFGLPVDHALVCCVDLD